MNIHHLELFYYVARFGGISEAVRNMPYGIQQPAMSGQIIQLEESLGVALFRRRPFSLTSSGETLFDYIRPFFENLGALEDELRGAAQHIGIGASEIILKDHLPVVLESVRKQFPKLRVTLKTGYRAELESAVQRQDIDLAVALVEGKPPAGLQGTRLLKLPLVLLVKKGSRIKSVEDLWKKDRIEQPLISLPASDVTCKNFQKGVSRLGVDWYTGIEVSSLQLVETYAANGYGIGLSIRMPGMTPGSGVRVLDLPDFPECSLTAIWQGKPGPVVSAFLAAIEARAKVVVNSQSE